jgi:RHS repeat-associated protein
MVHDIFGQLVADYKGSSLERENIYRGGQLLAVYEASTTCFKTIGTFVADFYVGIFGSGATTTYASDIATSTENLKLAQARGLDALLGEAQRMGNSVFTSTAYTSLGTSNTQYVTDLYKSYLQRNPDDPPDNNMSGRDWWVDQFNHGNTRAGVRQAFAVSTEFVEQVIGRLCAGINGTSTSANIKYVLTDVQGSTRLLMENNGTSSAILARHDYLPYGTELWSGVGSRTTSQGYAVTDKVRQRFALTERDEASGLDHTWFRKYDSFAGRWTSPDPYGGSMTVGNPQSFNRYSYVQNDPLNLVDPSGLDGVDDLNPSAPPIPTLIEYGGTITTNTSAPFGDDNGFVLEGDMGALPREPLPGGGGPLDNPGGNAPAPDPTPPVEPEQSTREERCLAALEAAERISRRISKTIADSLAAPGGADAGHVKKVDQLREGLSDEMRKVDANCNNKERQQNADRIQAANEVLNGKRLNVGDRLPIQEMKIAGAGAVILGALGGAAVTIYIWWLAH